MDKQNILHNIYLCKDSYDTSKFHINLLKENKSRYFISTFLFIFRKNHNIYSLLLLLFVVLLMMHNQYLNLDVMS